MDINPINCWNFVESPNQLLITDYPEQFSYDGYTMAVNKIDVSKYVDTILILGNPSDEGREYDIGIVLKYDSDYVSGTACDIVFPTGIISGGCVLYEDSNGDYHRLRSNYPSLTPDGTYYFESGEAIRVTLFIDKWTNKYYWQLSELIERQY
ncbi:hypothetical protein RVBP21_0600 [Pseudomonas phage BRkr]|nr:hypothetical protein RVBP21_0600 [Pseudomonas phage BRkr]